MNDDERTRDLTTRSPDRVTVTVGGLLSGLKLHQLMRYGYGGFLLVGILLFCESKYGGDKHVIADLVQSVGALVAIAVIISIGAAIYVMHRYVIGEFILYPATHAVHVCLFRLLKIRQPAGMLGYLKEKWRVAPGAFGIWIRRAIYTEIRLSFPLKENEQLDLFHSEAHTLWIACVIFSFAGLLVLDMVGMQEARWWLSVAAASGFGGLVADIQLHQREYRLYAWSEQFEGWFRERFSGLIQK